MVIRLVVLAHQGGWDEMLFVAIPIVLFVLLLRLANRRADRQASATPSQPPTDVASTASADDRHDPNGASSAPGPGRGSDPEATGTPRNGPA